MQARMVEPEAAESSLAGGRIQHWITENGDISSSASPSIVLLNIPEWKDQGGHIPGWIPSSDSSVALSPTQIFNGAKHTWNNLYSN